MTDLIITAVGDATIRSARPSLPDGSGDWVRVKSGEMRGLLLPELDNIRGRTVPAETLVGRVGPGHVAQTYTVTPITERWSPGRAIWGTAGGPAVDSAAAVTLAVPALPDGGLVEIPLDGMIQAVADGTDWFGVRISTNSTSASQKFYATDSGEPAWELHVTLSDAPDVPSNLRPDGGGAVDYEDSILAWDFVDLGGTSTDQADSWVQFDRPADGDDPDDVSPYYDTGWQTNVDPEWNLAAPPSGPGFAVTSSGGAKRYWRVQVRDGDGNASGWSDWAEYGVDPLPTLVVDSPTGTFGDPSPQLLAHLTGGTLKWWKAFATGPDRSDVREHAEVHTGAIDWQIPTRNDDGRRIFREDEQGWIYLQARDDKDRAVAVGQKAYVDVWIPATWDDDLGVEAPTNLMVTQLAKGDPRHVWSWDRTEAATAWLPQIDGVTIDRLEPEDVELSAGRYWWTDSGQVPPMRPHTLGVRALEGADRSTPATKVEHVSIVERVWLILENGDTIALSGTAIDEFVRTDYAATYVLQTGDQVDIIYGTPPRTGTFDGTVDALQDDVWAALDTIEALRKSRRRKVRQVWGSQSEFVRLRSPDATSHSEINQENALHAVRYSFIGVGD